MPDQHRDFFASQPFLVVAARDEEERLWATLLASPRADFVTSPDPKSLLIDTKPMPGGALEGAFTPGNDVGIMGIEFGTRHRNRVNGRIVTSSKKSQGLLSLRFRVDQSFGYFPQYIKTRQWWIPADTSPEIDLSVYLDYRSAYLSESQIHFIRQSETIFLATGYRGQGNDPRYGNDASNRGGSPGFVHVRDRKTIIIPDFSGNNHFNTIGNLVLDIRIGITFPNYQTGSMIQITGTARTNFDYNVAIAFYAGAEPLIEISIDAVVWLPEGSIPVRWTTDVEELKERNLVVSAKIKESEDVVSFPLRSQDNDLRDLWRFQSGQHLPIALQVGPFDRHFLERTYSISAGPDWDEYRISVKRQGEASNYLHDNVHIGDTLLV